MRVGNNRHCPCAAAGFIHWRERSGRSVACNIGGGVFVFSSKTRKIIALCQVSLAFWLDLYPFRGICPARLPDRETMNIPNFKKLFMPDTSADAASLIHAIASATAVIAALIAASAMIIAHMTSDVKNRKRSINPTRYMKDGKIRYSSRAPAPLDSSTRTTGQLAVGLAPAPPPSTRWICFY